MMKKTLSLLLFVLMIAATAKAQSEWVTQKLDNQISVKFPSEPKKLNANGVDTYSAKGKDSVAYIAAMLDFQTVANMDAATLASIKDNQQFADQFKQGFMSSRPEFTVGDIKIGKWKDYTSYTLSGTNNKTNATLYLQTIIIGSKMYMTSCVVPANTPGQGKDIWFNSVELIK